MNREEVETLYDKLLAEDTKLTRKGKSMPYTSFNGHMFSFISKPEAGKESFVAIRLPKMAQEKFMKKYGTEPVKQHGATMQGYVELPQKLLMDTDAALSYLQQSHAYVSTLKPK